MDTLQVDWVAIGIAAFLNIVIGFVWYSKWLFGSLQMCQKKESRQSQIQSILGAIVISLVTAFFLAFFEGYLEVTTVSDGMFVGFCLWLGFVVTTQISTVIWQGRPFKFFLVDTSYKLLAFLVMSGIIGA